MVAASSVFCRKAEGRSDGASWTDFANAARGVAQGLAEPLEALEDLEKQFRQKHLEPLLEGLELLQRVDALPQLQEAAEVLFGAESRERCLTRPPTAAEACFLDRITS